MKKAKNKQTRTSFTATASTALNVIDVEDNHHRYRANGFGADLKLWMLLLCIALCGHFPGLAYGQGEVVSDTSLMFSIWFPSTPQKQQQIIDTDFGEVEVTAYSLQPNDKNEPALLYRIACTRYPREILTRDSVELAAILLEAVLEQALERDGGTLMYQSDISHRAYPGLLWRIRLPNERHQIYARAFAIDDRIFTLVVYMAGRRSETVNSTRFFESFSAR